MASPQHPAGTSPQGRPNAQGMSQGTYTGNVSFSRGNSDLISKGAALPGGGASIAPTPAPTPQTPAPPEHHFPGAFVAPR